MARRRVLVTGSSGFLGRQIVAALAALGAEAVPPAEPRPDLLAGEARRALVADARADTLIHAAWVTQHGVFWESAENLDWVGASLDLLSAFAAAGGKRVVLVGSCAEYDWSRPTRTPWRETRPTRPASLYGAAKLGTWTVAAAFAAHAGLPPACARVFLPVGRHEAPGRLLPALIAALLGGTELCTGPAHLTRDLIDVRDAGEAIARLALSDTSGPVNIGSGRPTTLGELVQRAACGASHSIRVGARPLRAGEPVWMVADPARLRRATGFLPRYTLDDTIADAFAYWRAAA